MKSGGRLNRQTGMLSPGSVKVYSMRAAADYCGKSVDTLKKHKYRTKYFAPYGRKVGGSLVFFLSELIKMRLWFREHGRRGKHSRPTPKK